jgi:hypothetical protein
MMKSTLGIGGALFATFVVAASLAYGGTASGSASPSRSGFSARVDNPWFPLTPGTRYFYRGIKDGRPSREIVTVTHGVKTIQGAPCVVVEDRLFVQGRLHERTTDWYSQDQVGNVWYFGETTAELDRQGRIKSREGSWQAGRAGAKAGIFMPARPVVGRSFRQEFFKGHAEDHFQIVRLGATVHTAFRTSKSALLTKEWTPLEPGVVDHKFYVRGIGTVLELMVKGGTERNELVALRRGL